MRALRSATIIPPARAVRGASEISLLWQQYARNIWNAYIALFPSLPAIFQRLLNVEKQRYREPMNPQRTRPFLWHPHCVYNFMECSGVELVVATHPTGCKLLRGNDADGKKTK